MTQTITGRVIQVLPMESGVSQQTGRTWARQEYVLEYPSGDRIRQVAVRVEGDNIARLALRLGEEYTLLVSISSRLWNDRWYTSVEAWGRKDMATGAYHGAGAWGEQTADAVSAPQTVATTAQAVQSAQPAQTAQPSGGAGARGTSAGTVDRAGYNLPF